MPIARPSGAAAVTALPGLALALLGGLSALWGSAMLQRWGLALSGLMLSILLGMAMAPLLERGAGAALSPGLALAQRRLLRLGVALYGLRLDLPQLWACGWPGLLSDLLVIVSVLGAALWLGQRWLKLDRTTCLLIGAGSAICGAAAVMAAESVLRAKAHQVAVAVATVTVFGSIAMLAYPMLYPLLGLSVEAYARYVGSTVHEVAQVVVAAQEVSSEAADQALVVKLLRVALLAPVLMLLARAPDSATAAVSARSWIPPLFLWGFALCAALHSTGLLPSALLQALGRVDDAALAAAMLALGSSTRLSLLRAAGPRPLLLGALLFALLGLGGYCLQRALMVAAG
jgi:uncharacterized integral membrane protein (TIGR00698 family)